MYKGLTSHALAKKLLTFPDLHTWINVDNGEGGRLEWNVSVEDSHACDIDLDEALGNERLYAEDEETPIYSPIIYIYDECNKPDYSHLLWAEIENYGYKYQTIQIPNNSFTNSDRITKHAKDLHGSEGWKEWLIIDKTPIGFKLSKLRMYRDLVGTSFIGDFNTLEELIKLEKG